MDHAKERASPTPERDSRTRLLDAAKRVFAHKGFDGATVKELADEAGVNVSLVSYYFGGKEGLYRACLERFGLDRLATAERILKAPDSVEDFRVRLKLFFEEFIECHIQEPEITTILHRECLSDMAGIRDLFRGVFGKSFERISRFFRDAQKAGFVRRDVDPQLTVMLTIGGLIHALRIDPIFQQLHGRSIRDPKHREAVIDQLLRNLLNGVLR